jgi:3-hydroxybutyryl-CoA dehydrogenase
MEIALVGVVGAGVIGAGVAQNLAQTGHQVMVVDVSPQILEHARDRIGNNIRLQSLLAKAEPVRSPDQALAQISFSTDYASLASVDFVIENVTEKWEVKKEVFARLDTVCPAPCVLASNTSVLPITRLAAVTNRSPQVIGVHFMNPVPLKPTVEVIRPPDTSDQTLEITKRLLAQMGKRWVIVNDSPGFVSNRVLMLAINEAIFLLQEQIAGAEDVDRIFRECFGHKMGPLETADLIGLDTVLYSIQGLYESFDEEKYRPCPLLVRMVEDGLTGQKSGQGFYAYPAGTS